MPNFCGYLKKGNNRFYPFPYYPVGFVYISTDNTSPASIYGGTWQRVEDDVYLKNVLSNGGVIGGTSSNHKIPISSLTAHTHSIHMGGTRLDPSGDNVIKMIPGVNSGSGDFWSVGLSREIGSYSGGITASGDGQPYYPYYLGVYIWKKIA